MWLLCMLVYMNVFIKLINILVYVIDVMLLGFNINIF